MKYYIIIFFSLVLLSSCSQNDIDDTSNNMNEPKLIVKFVFDENQERLNNFGQPATVPAGNAAQTPSFNTMSAHYIELAQNANTPLGNGAIIYEGLETTVGGAAAIHFDQAVLVQENQTFMTIPLSQIIPGTYEWVRTSLSYQNYNIDVLQSGTTFNGTLSSFVGFNTYIGNHIINNETIVVNENKAQGFWAFEVMGQVFQGQAPEGATTVPNPIFATSPIPQGSCVVTGAFSDALVITGNETEDIIITLSLSINNSFEWEEVNNDGLYEPSAGEQVVDMGFRGLIPYVSN